MENNPTGFVRPEPATIPVIPTVGRIVLFTPDEDGQKITARKGYQAFPAVITHVWTPMCVNLAVINDGSFPLPSESLKPTSVEYANKPGDAPRTWSWPPRAGA
jgi:hypothetical protein